jgi:hypothetical protein
MQQFQGRNLIAALAAAAALAATDTARSRENPQLQIGQPQQQSSAVDKDRVRQLPLVMAATPSQADAAATTGPARERRDAELDQQLVDFNGRLTLYTWCLALIAALQFAALIVQAFFLWKTLRIARESADALPALERAYIFVKPKISLPLALGWNAGAELADRTVSIKYSFTNHGKTPAIIKGIDARFDVSAEAPDNTEHQSSKALDNEAVVDAKRSSDPDEVFIGRVISADEVKALKEGRLHLWFFGSILYEDISQKPHVTRFRWRYEGAQQSFAPAGAAPFNDRT